MNEVDNLFEMAEETLEEVTEMFDGFNNVPFENTWLRHWNF